MIEIRSNHGISIDQFNLVRVTSFNLVRLTGMENFSLTVPFFNPVTRVCGEGVLIMPFMTYECYKHVWYICHHIIALLVYPIYNMRSWRR